MSFSAPLAAVQCCMWLAIALPSTQGEHSCHCTKFHALWCQQDHPSTPNPWNDTRTACSLICLLSHRHCLPYPTKLFGDHSKAAGQRSHRKLAASSKLTAASFPKGWSNFLPTWGCYYWSYRMCRYMSNGISGSTVQVVGVALYWGSRQHQARQKIESKYRKRCGLGTVFVLFLLLWSSALRKSKLREKGGFVLFCLGFVFHAYCSRGDI